MAEQIVTGEGLDTGAGATGEGNSQGQEKSYTEEDFTAEVDRRVTEGIKTARAKWEKEYSEKLEAEKAEAARMAKLSAEERAKAQFESDKKKFEAEREKHEAEHREFECTRKLAEDGLPTSFAKMLTGATEDETAVNITAFKTAFAEAVEAKVTERLKGSSPKGFTGGDGGGGKTSGGFFDIINKSHR